MRIAHKTSLSRASARRKVDSLLAALQKKYGEFIASPKKSWDSDVMRFSVKIYGFPVDGTISLGDSVIVLEGKVPLLARPFEQKIQSSIKSVMDEELS